jgi:cytochrome c556
MSWETIKTDIESAWRDLITDIEDDAPKVEAVLKEIMTVLGGIAAVSGGPAVADISAVAQGLYGLVNVTATTAQAVAPTAGPSVTATQLVAAADAVATAVPGFASAIKAVVSDAETVASDLKADAGH